MSAPKCLRWDSHEMHLKRMFTHQMDAGRFTDITLACEGGQTLKAHRSVLCACSEYFNSVLTDANWDRDTLVIMKDCNFDVMQLLLTFFYIGEISVQQVRWIELDPAAQ